MRSIFTAFARNLVFANIVLVFLLVGGALAAINMVRETFPEFSLGIISVRVPWPGADPEEVEEGIVRKIEEAIQGIEGIRQYNGIARENMGTVVVEVLESYSVDHVRDRVRNAVDSIPTFPVDAEKPITEEIILREEVMMIALSGRRVSERQLKEWAERVKEELRMLPQVSQVQVLGARDYEIGIEVSEERLREYGLTFSQVADAVRANSLNLSAGIMRTEGEEIRLRTMGRRYTGEELAGIILAARPTGEIITLDRIATIEDGFTEDPIVSRFNGEPTITVVVLKTREEDALVIDRAVRAYVDEQQQQLPEGASMIVWGATSDILEARINLLLRNGLIGLMLVFILLWLFLDLRLSFWAGMGMPVSIMGGMILMYAMGATINMISLFAMIMVLGIVVADAIVVGEAIYVARRKGAGRLQAAVDGVMEVGLPVIAAVTTSIVAFLPLLFIGGIMGKFIRIMPIVVIAALIISLIECLIILPAHLSHLPDPNRQNGAKTRLGRFAVRMHRFTNHGLERFVSKIYTPFLSRALHFRYVSICCAITVLLITMGVIRSGMVKFEFFPPIDGDVITATVEFPDGTPFEVTREAVQRVETALANLDERLVTSSRKPLLVNTFSITGSTFIEGFEPPRQGSNFGSVRAQLLPAQERGILSDDLMVLWEEEARPLPGITAFTFQGLEAGPPGAPIELWLQGHNMPRIRAAAELLKERLETYQGVYQITDDFRAGKNEIRLELKPEARPLGLSVADLARQVQAGYFGEEAFRLQRGRDDIRVRVRYPAEERRHITDFEQVRVRTPQGHEVPLLSVANLSFGPGYASINRTDGMRKVGVTAEVGGNTNANEVFQDLERNFLPQLRHDFPDVQISAQGEQLRARESLGGLQVTYPLALIGMFIIIATIFRSYIQPFLILVAVPFGIIGAIVGHMLLGYEVSFMSMMGFVALSGVVVNDAIILIEAVNTNLAKGTTFFEAIRQGGARRFRAVFLTSVTTIGGLMPLMLERDVQARFLIPMAISISGGVAFATVITLVLIPCMLVILNDMRRILHYLRYQTWPTREAVEPATYRESDPDALESAAEARLPDTA